MTLPVPVNPPDPDAAPYDVGNIDIEGDLMPPGDAATITALASVLRLQILNGTYAPGQQIPSRVELARANGMSAESAGLVMRMLRDEGLLSLEQGRGTFVRPLRDYHITVTLPAPLLVRGQKTRLEHARQQHPAVRHITITGTTWDMTVRSADPALAVNVAFAAARLSAGPGDWQFDQASATVEPGP